MNTTFSEGRERDRALGIWAAADTAGLTVGALLGGVLTEVVSWRGLFFVNVPLTPLGMVGAVACLAGDPERERLLRNANLTMRSPSSSRRCSASARWRPAWAFLSPP